MASGSCFPRVNALVFPNRIGHRVTITCEVITPPSAANDYEGMLKTSDGSTITGKFTDPGVSLSKFVWLTVTIKGATNVDVISSCNLGENLNMELVEQALKFTMSAKGEGIFY